MDVKLYYIEGISRTDTPYYAEPGRQATLARQAEYFASKLVRTVSTSFYPPHYTNEIKFDTDDIDFDDTINYLSLLFRGKEYYYFIDDIEYMNEGVVKLYVTMDTIQTYMFNIRIASGVIERKFINRWNGNVINRNYLRENVSSQEFIPTLKRYVNDDSSQYVIVMKQTKVDKSSTLANIMPETTVVTENMSIPYFKNYSVPYDLKFCPGGEYTWNLGNNRIASMQQTIASGAYIAETVDMYVCPFNPFSDIEIFKDTGSVHLEGNFNVDYLNFNDMHGETTYYIKPGLLLSTAVHTDEWRFTTTFVKNAGVGVAFNSKFVPALLDNNYIRYTFGSSTVRTDYPLYRITALNLYARYLFDFSTGARIYYINQYESDIGYDRFGTIVIDTNILSVDLKNDAWASYISANKNRWAIMNNNNIANISNAGLSTAGSFSKYGKIGVDASKIETVNYGQARNAKGQYTRGIKRLGKTTVNQSRDVYGQIPTEGNYTSLAASAIDAGNSILNQVAVEDNLLHTPATSKQVGEFGSVLLSQQHLIYHEQSKVIDYEQCAQYFHRNGYLINEYVNNINDIFNYVVNRYYYNILKMSLPEVHLIGVIEDQGTIDSIKSRLEDGVRLWSRLGNISHDEYTETRDDFGTYTTFCPWQIRTIHYITASIVPGTGSGSVSVTDFSYDATTRRITYTLSGGADTGARFNVVVHGSFIEPVTNIPIGDFEYDNVELDYLS